MIGINDINKIKYLDHGKSGTSKKNRLYTLLNKKLLNLKLKERYQQMQEKA